MRAPIQFGKYYLLDRVAVGGMAEVYRAKTFFLEGSERIVALKRMLPMVSADKELVSMFIDEAKLAIQLKHPNICQVFDWGKVEDSYYLAMEYVSGCDLRAVFQRCRQQNIDGLSTMPMAQACFVVMKLCEGLDYAHNKKDPLGQDLGLVHRDVSPPNIMLSYEGEVKLIDFGIAKVHTERQAQTEAGVLKGKFAYMSPEQVRGEVLDRRSDIFSVGIVLYELLTGERLFPVDNELSSLEKIRNVEILPPSSYNRRIPEELERIVMRALSREPAERYQTAMELHGELQQFMYTAGEFYSRKELSAWLKRVYKNELEQEQAALDSAREFRPATIPTQSSIEPLMRVRATMSMAAVRLPGEQTGSLRVAKEPTGALRPPKEAPVAPRTSKEIEAEKGSAWTPGRGRSKRPGSTPPPPPRQAVQSIAEAASTLASQVSDGRSDKKPAESKSAQAADKKSAQAADKKSAQAADKRSHSASREEDTAVDSLAEAGKIADPRFNDDSLSTRPFEPQDRAIIEAAARQGQLGTGVSGSELDEAPTRAFKPETAEELANKSGADPGDLATAIYAPVREDPKQLSGGAAHKPSSGMPPRPQPASLGDPPSQSTPEPLHSASSESPSEQSPLPGLQPRSGSATGDVKPVSVLPPPALSLPPTLEVTPPSANPPPSTRNRGLVLVLAALLLLLLGGGAYYMFGRSGELIIIAEPGRELVVLIDQLPVAVTDSPVRLRLQPGAHAVMVQHSGHKPWNESMSFGAGETVVRNIRLEPLVQKTGGFTLLSDPPGAMVTLDGAPLNQVTPLRVQSVLAGPHTLELRLGARIWHQQINVEAEKTIDVKATLPPADVPVVTPGTPGVERPTVTPLETPKGPQEKPEKSPVEKGVAEAPVKAEKPEKKDPVAERPVAKATPNAMAKGLKGVRGKKRPGGTGTDTPAGPVATGNNGYLRINSRPWSKIIVDGLDTGLNTPQTSYRIPAGRHQVTLFNPQFNIKETIVVTVQPGETQTITKVFQR